MTRALTLAALLATAAPALAHVEGTAPSPEPVLLIAEPLPTITAPAPTCDAALLTEVFAVPADQITAPGSGSFAIACAGTARE